MNEGDIGLIVLAACALVCPLLAHWRIARYVPASFVGGVGAALLFQGLAALQLGHLDPFAPIAFVVSLVITIPASFLIGMAFRARRRGAAARSA